MALKKRILSKIYILSSFVGLKSILLTFVFLILFHNTCSQHFVSFFSSTKST